MKDLKSDEEDLEDEEGLEEEKVNEEESLIHASKSCSNHPLANGCDDNWTWNFKEKSHEVRLYGPKRRIAHFHPNWSNGTAGVRGNRILNNGRYYWELNVSQRIFGTR